MKIISFKKFYELIKDKEFDFNGIPLTFSTESYIRGIASLTINEDSVITITNTDTNIKMSYKESDSEITYNKTEDFYVLKCNGRKHIFKIN